MSQPGHFAAQCAVTDAGPWTCEAPVGRAPTGRSAGAWLLLPRGAVNGG